MSNIDNLDDELDELSKDTTLKDLLKFRTRMPTKASPQLEQRLRASYKQHLAKRKKKDLFSKLKGWYANLSTENIRFRYAIPLGTLAVASLIIGVGIYAFFYKEKTTEIGALHNTPTPINTPSPIATDGMRSGDGVAISLKDIKKLYIKLGSDPWGIKLAQEITLSVKQLNWTVVTDPKSADAGLRLDKNKLIIFNKANNILWQKEIDLSVNPTDLTQIVIADLKKS